METGILHAMIFIIGFFIGEMCAWSVAYWSYIWHKKKEDEMRRRRRPEE